MELNPNLPKYEIRAKNRAPGDLELTIWQIPCSATPNVVAPIRIAGLHGKNLSLIEHRVLRTLKSHDIDIIPTGKEIKKAELNEEVSMNLGLLFRLLAPMRSLEKMHQTVQAIEEMGKDEVAYWLGMSMHRKNPRRVLSALRLLLSASY